MKEIFFNTIQEFNDFIGVKTLHPLVSIARVENTAPIQEAVHHYGLYALFLKENKGCKLSYGRTEYDFDEMTVTSFAPGQSVKVKPNPEVPFAKYTVLAFHPDLLQKTPLARLIKEYSYFSYNANEALHLSGQERETVLECMNKIRTELQHPVDKHSRSLITDNIKLLLDYCIRFYDRQFITRENTNHDILTRFESLLDDYFASDAPAQSGMPSVQYCAGKLCLSPNYLGDLLRKETGMSALKHIQQKTLDIARERMSDASKSIGEISYELGFPYPQHFSRWFKKMTGYTPNGYRMEN